MTRFSTYEIDPSFDLVANLPAEGGLLFSRAGDGLVAWGEAARIEVGTGPGRFAQAESSLTRAFDSFTGEDPLRLPGTGPVAFGSFAFDDDSDSVLVVPEVVLGRADGRAWATVADGRKISTPRPPQTSQASPARIRYAGATLPEIQWLEAVADATSVIEREQLDKVVLARDLLVWSERPLDERALAAQLAARFPDCFTFLEHGLIGASPELLVRRVGGRASSVVLAGSARRGEHDEEDVLVGKELQASEKENLEHRIAVDSVREPLATIASEVEVDPEPHLMRLANVQHLATRVEARLSPALSALEVAGLLHPTAAVCGTPRDDARSFIKRREGMARARYAGPVGWVDARGDGEWTIALRCAQLRDDRARLFAGAGIVAGSVPETELEETRLKLRAMQSALEAGPS